MIINALSHVEVDHKDEGMDVRRYAKHGGIGHE
jgi:hypothetical protein